MSAKKKKIRAEFRKNRTSRARQGDWTRKFADRAAGDTDETPRDERLSGKGELTRKRVVVTDETVDGDAAAPVVLAVDQANCQPGRVLSVHGRTARVEAQDGSVLDCVTRRLLRTLSTDQRHVVAAGDRVLFRLAGDGTGSIERIEPRRGILRRASRGRQHISVTNVDQLLIVGSAAEPDSEAQLDRSLSGDGASQPDCAR